MIHSWKDAKAEQVFKGKSPKGFPSNLLKSAQRRLAALDAASSVEDLKFPPGNRLHALTGDRDGQWSISVNAQFRICFRWTETGPEDVEFVDYH